MQDIFGRLSSILFSNEYIVTIVEDEEAVALAASFSDTV